MIEFEVLISTQNKRSLDFLKPMFQNNEIGDVHLLIINQTQKGKELHSNMQNVRVVNSYEKGSPQSRNLAIKNAKGDICLFADDDIIYHNNFKEIILNTHKEFPEQDVITFEAVNAKNERYMSYHKEGSYITNKVFYVNTYVISFKREIVQETNSNFNPLFGVGSVFPGSTEYFFMRNAFDNGLKLYHKNIFIVKHEGISSGLKQGSDDAVFSKTARYYFIYGWLSVLWLVKYIFFLVRHKYIKTNEVYKKFKLGIKAIFTYRKLSKQS